MAAPKRKHPEPHPAPRMTAAEREAAEDRADAEAGKRALAKWEANGRPASIPADEVKRQLGIK